MRTKISDRQTPAIETTAQAADNRRSIRHYDRTPIPAADLRELLDRKSVV